MSEKIQETQERLKKLGYFASEDLAKIILLFEAAGKKGKKSIPTLLLQGKSGAGKTFLAETFSQMIGADEKFVQCFPRMGTENFQYDGKAPKVIMTQDGTIYKPVSKLFLLYNYAKVLKKKGDFEGLEAFKKEFPHAFTVYGDEGHTEHDLFYRQQVEQYEEVLFYPIYQRVYKAGRGPQDFFVYYDVEKSVPVSHIISI